MPILPDNPFKMSPTEIVNDIESLTGSARLNVLSLKNLDQISTGGFVGSINFAGTLAQFANAKRNQYWKADVAGTIGGLTFGVGDRLVCKQDVTGTPANLTDTNFWAKDTNVLPIATASSTGVVKVGNGISVQADGTVAVKVGAGIKLDALNNVSTDNANIDVFSLKNVGLLNKGNYIGDVPASATGLTDAVKGDWWKASSAKTLLGTSFAIGDELYCVANQTGTPATLANFLRVPNTQAIMIGATAGAAGSTGQVPAPASGSQNNFLKGDATFSPLKQLSGVDIFGTGDISSSFNPLSLGNRGSGAVCTDAQLILATHIIIAQSTSGQTLSLPTSPTYRREITVVNTGSANFAMHGATVFAAGGTQRFVYDGTAWRLMIPVIGQGSGTWNVGTGAGTYSFTIPGTGVYMLSVYATAANGIATYTATIFASNSNVPVVGNQYAYYYDYGNGLVWTSIPSQIQGTSGQIYAYGTIAGNAYQFNFGLTNNSGAATTASWTYTQLR